MTTPHDRNQPDRGDRRDQDDQPDASASQANAERRARARGAERERDSDARDRHDHVREYERDPDADNDADESERTEQYDGRIRKGEKRNPWGRAGNPANRSHDLPETDDLHVCIGREFDDELEVPIDGKITKMSKRRLFARQLVHDLLKAPLKDKLHAFNPRYGLARYLLYKPLDEDENANVWTDELEEEFRIIDARYFGGGGEPDLSIADGDDDHDRMDEQSRHGDDRAGDDDRDDDDPPDLSRFN